MKQKLYTLYGLNTAVHLLRPGAKRWEITDSKFSIWEDPRPCPTWHEIEDTLIKIKNFEDSLDTIWLPEQIQDSEQQENDFHKAVHGDS